MPYEERASDQDFTRTRSVPRSGFQQALAADAAPLAAAFQVEYSSPCGTAPLKRRSVRPRTMKASSSGIRGTFFFVGAMLAVASCEAVIIFALGQYEQMWTPSLNFLLEILASAVLMGIVATLFAVSTVLNARNNYVSVAWCAVLGAAYAMGLFVLIQMLPRILNADGWPFVLCIWVYALGAPPSLGLLIARRRSSEEAQQYDTGQLTRRTAASMGKLFAGLFLLILGLLGMTAVYSVRPDRVWTMLNQKGAFDEIVIESPFYEAYLILFGVCSFFGMLLTFAGFRNRRKSARERSQMRGSVSATELDQSFLIVVVRWIVVVPTAIMSDMLFDSIIVHVAQWIFGHILSVNDLGLFVPLLSGVAGALAFVLSGAVVAPHSRGIVVLVLAALEVIVGSLFLGFFVTGVMPHSSPLLAGVNFIGHVLGSAAGFYIVFRAFGWRRHGEMSLLWRA